MNLLHISNDCTKKWSYIDKGIRFIEEADLLNKEAQH